MGIVHSKLTSAVLFRVGGGGCNFEMVVVEKFTNIICSSPGFTKPDVSFQTQKNSEERSGPCSSDGNIVRSYELGVIVLFKIYDHQQKHQISDLPI